MIRGALWILGTLVLWLVVLGAGPIAGGQPVAGMAGRWVKAITFEIKHPDNQWIVWLFFLIYLLTFLWLPVLRGWRSSRDMGGHACLVTGLAVVGGLWYSSGYPEAASRWGALVWITGMLCGQAVAFIAADDEKRRSTVILTLVLVLAGLACWHPDAGRDYHYRGQERWVGIWENPNRYGLLMALGCLLAFARICHLAARSRKGKEMGWRTALEGALLVPASAVLATGLLQSFSRAAWLGFVWGVVFVLWQFGRRRQRRKVAGSGATDADSANANESASQRTIPGAFVKRHSGALLAIAVAAGIMGFWTFRHVEMAPVRRALSAANVNDFSWRNRVYAYEAALGMMSDRPWAGFGWDQPQRYCAPFYARPKLEETVAITLNDVFAIGTTLGLPALAMFAGLVFVCFRRPPLKRKEDSGGGGLPDWTIVASRGGAIVLLVGFWFGNGLFYLALGAPFWVLLEFARAPGDLREDGADKGRSNVCVLGGES